MKIKGILLKSIPFLLLFSFCVGAYMEQAKGQAEIERDLALRLALVESNVGLGIKDNLDRMRGLATHIGLNTDFEVSEINYFVEEILNGDTTIINNIGVFEDTTAVYVYPYEENEAVKYINLVELPPYKEDALRVKEDFETIITLPAEMVQGGIGIIIRLPILTIDKEYWGQIGYMMRYENVIESLGIEEDKYHYRIEQINQDDDKAYEVYDSGFNPKAINSSIIIELPSSYWEISVSNASWYETLSITFWLLLVMGSLLYYFAIKVIKQNEAYVEKLRYQSDYDEMTGVLNRRSGIEKVDSMIKNNEEFSLVFMDLDGLKQVNDQHGHQNGDRLIQNFVNIVNLCIRSYDVFARVGGDEFVLAVKNISGEVNEGICQRIMDEIEDVNGSGTLPFKMAFSYGVEKVSSGSVEKVDDLIKMADKKMYQEKAKKKNRINIDTFS